MTLSLVMAGGFALFLVRNRPGRVRNVVTAVVAGGAGFAWFLWATGFYAAGGLFGVTP